MLNINILDLGINNLSSITKAFKAKSQCKIDVIDDGNKWNGADLIVLPGVGAFGAALDNLHQRNFIELLEAEKSAGTRIAGICLGMQLLTQSSEESEGRKGLGFFQANISQLPTDLGERVPHMGWNNVHSSNTEDFFRNSDGRDFYFVHSYALLGTNEHTLGITKFGSIDFSSSILKENVVGFQFHPEKSSSAGASLIDDLVEWASA